MNMAAIKKAKAEAKRFLDAVRGLEADQPDGARFKYLMGSKHTGAVRRSSMDLTRALADMRKN